MNRYVITDRGDAVSPEFASFDELLTAYRAYCSVPRGGGVQVFNLDQVDEGRDGLTLAERDAIEAADRGASVEDALALASAGVCECCGERPAVHKDDFEVHGVDGKRTVMADGMLAAKPTREDGSE